MQQVIKSSQTKLVGGKSSAPVAIKSLTQEKSGRVKVVASKIITAKTLKKQVGFKSLPGQSF
jgi:hypothetical protein